MERKLFVPAQDGERQKVGGRRIFAKITLLFLKAYNRAGASCSWHSNTLLSMPENIKLVSIATERNGFLYRETYKMAASHEDERSALRNTTTTWKAIKTQRTDDA